jgi:serine/threonine protein kinase
VEAIAQARLNHPNIVTIHSFEQQKDSYHIVMEYVEGKTLKGIIKETGKLPVKQALKIFSGLLEGMAYAHKKGVLHRDIKPANIYITSTGTVKIGDFGIAKVSGIDGLTRVGVTVGTLLYSSPEQIRGEKMGPTTDIYSLGVTLYEMLTGVQPFKAGSGSDFEVQKAHLEIIPQKPSTLNSEVPPALDAVVMKSLAKDPRQRFPGIAAFQKAIDSPSAEKTPARDSQDFKKPLVNNLINGLINIKKTVNRAAEAVRVSTGTGHVRHHEKKRKLLVVALISLVILLFVLIAFSFAREPVSKHSDHLNGIENINKNNEKKSCRISRTSRFSNISLRQKKEA